MKVEIFGTGCAKCRRMKNNVEKAVRDLSIDAEIISIDDLDEMSERGVMITPALFIDGEAKAMGRVPGVSEIVRMLTGS